MIKEKKNKIKICFLHYGIGWKDGVNSVITSFAESIQTAGKQAEVCFLAGEIKKRIKKRFLSWEIKELLPKKEEFSKSKEYFLEKGEIIAKKISEIVVDNDIKKVIIENPLMGDYHLAAMLGFLFFTQKYKPEGVEVFFRVHDFFLDEEKYYKHFNKIFSPEERKKLFRSKGINRIFIINKNLKNKLRKIGFPQNKIYYLPNGLEIKRFGQKPGKSKLKKIKKNLGFSQKDKILLYPVRIVSRKNIEEAILLTYFIRLLTGSNYVLFVPGEVDKRDPLTEDYFQNLKKLKEVVNFRIVFGKRIKASIFTLYNLAEAVIITSIKEGFGLPFLECWAAKKVIIGRRIKIISDFEEKGLVFNWLYKSFFLNGYELSKIGEERFSKRISLICKVFEDKRFEKKVLKMNQKAIESQVDLLKNKEKREEIIKKNFLAVKKNYDIGKIRDKFLKLINLH